MLKVAAGFEIGTLGALKLALFFFKVCPAVWAGSFDFLDIDSISGAIHGCAQPIHGSEFLHVPVVLRLVILLFLAEVLGKMA
jgi:hypothetical protein